MVRRVLAAGLLIQPISSAYTFSYPYNTCIWNPAGPLNTQHPTTCSPLYPLDEETATSLQPPSGHPWSVPPSCLRAANNPQAQYCVFATHAFRATSSLSLITTPKVASLVHAHHMIHDPVYEWVAAGAVTPARAPRLLRPAHVRLGEDEAAAGVRDGRRGVVASRMVRKGEVVMVGYPSIIGRMRLAKAVSAEQERELVAEAVARLPGEAKAELLALAKEKEGEGKVEDVLKTNVFGIDVGGSQHFGVFPSLSWINHGCDPNAITRFDHRSMTMDVVAYQDIYPGQEITISYMPLGLPTSQRTPLLKVWNITCTCRLCTDPAFRASSDTRRLRIRTLRGRLEDADTPPGSRSEAAALADELLGLLDEERLWSQVGEDYEALASLFLELGDTTRARRCAEMAIEMWKEYGGADETHPQVLLARWFLLKVKREEVSRGVVG